MVLSRLRGWRCRTCCDGVTAALRAHLLLGWADVGALVVEEERAPRGQEAERRGRVTDRGAIGDGA
jgi:hypothetical protein